MTFFLSNNGMYLYHKVSTLWLVYISLKALSLLTLFRTRYVVAGMIIIVACDHGPCRRISPGGKHQWNLDVMGGYRSRMAVQCDDTHTTVFAVYTVQLSVLGLARTTKTVPRSRTGKHSHATSTYRTIGRTIGPSYYTVLQPCVSSLSISLSPSAIYWPVPLLLHSPVFPPLPLQLLPISSWLSVCYYYYTCIAFLFHGSQYTLSFSRRPSA